VIVGAAPGWFADHLALIAIVVLAAVTLLVLRVVVDVTTRLIIIGAVVAVAVFVYVNRVPLEECARTCECRIVRQDVTVPFCDSDLDL
jgi:hypothetical protein